MKFRGAPGPAADDFEWLSLEGDSGTLRVPDDQLQETIHRVVGACDVVEVNVEEDDIDFGGLLGIVPGIALLIGTAIHYRIAVGAVQVIGYIVALIVMTAMYMALMVIFRLPAFWTVRTDSLEELEGELSNFAWRVPGAALRGVERLMFLVVLPYGLVATVPTEMLYGALSPVGILAVVLIAAAQMTVAAVGWRLSLRRYSSASS